MPRPRSRSVAVHGCRIQTLDVAGQPLLSFDSLQVALNEVQPLRRIVDIAAIDWSGYPYHIGRDAKGALTLPGVNQPVDDASVKTPPTRRGTGIALAGAAGAPGRT
jgi:hypothetical protein